MSQGSFSPKIRFLGQKVCSVARRQTDSQTDTKVNTEDTLSEFQDFSNFSSIYHQGAVQYENVSSAALTYLWNFATILNQCSQLRFENGRFWSFYLNALYVFSFLYISLLLFIKLSLSILFYTHCCNPFTTWSLCSCYPTLQQVISRPSSTDIALATPHISVKP